MYIHIFIKCHSAQIITFTKRKQRETRDGGAARYVFLHQSGSRASLCVTLLYHAFTTSVGTASGRGGGTSPLSIIGEKGVGEEKGEGLAKGEGEKAVGAKGVGEGKGETLEGGTGL